MIGVETPRVAILAAVETINADMSTEVPGPGLALVVTGLANERPVVWGLALIAVAIAMAMSLATRWAGSGPQ